jgi:hypothetical protein
MQKFKVSQLVPRPGLNLQHESRRFRVNEVTRAKSRFIARMLELGAQYPEAILAYEQSLRRQEAMAYVRQAGGVR